MTWSCAACSFALGYRMTQCRLGESTRESGDTFFAAFARFYGLNEPRVIVRNLRKMQQMGSSPRSALRSSCAH